MQPAKFTAMAVVRKPFQPATFGAKPHPARRLARTLRSELNGRKPNSHREGERARENKSQNAEGCPGPESFPDGFEEKDQKQKNTGENEAVGDQNVVRADRHFDDRDGIETSGVVLHGPDLKAEINDVPVAPHRKQADESEELKQCEDDAFGQSSLQKV